ncbi:MAG: dethiobiotin synthase [Rhodocyclaceae bacterium]|nr:dethiobiotin synthase [Rhodocyclaceae bacterium]MDZ4215173.1 dethiobiotin synthase [Rhodocyclaceae bacterium]
MSKAYFITATGTDLGKTWLTAGLVAAVRARGMPVQALKPVMSGYDPARHADSDLAKVGAGKTAWVYAAPLSPDLAAAKEGKTIDFAALVDWCRSEIASHEGLLLIEGVGGVMVPLTASQTVREWMAALGVPVVLVCGTYLGSLSHTLSALAALREVGVVPAVIVVNESAASTVSVEDTLASLVPHIGPIPLVRTRRDQPGDLNSLAETLLRPA